MRSKGSVGSGGIRNKSSEESECNGDDKITSIVDLTNKDKEALFKL